jgi:hypothetical protein
VRAQLAARSDTSRGQFFCVHVRFRCQDYYTKEAFSCCHDPVWTEFFGNQRTHREMSGYHKDKSP